MKSHSRLDKKVRVKLARSPEKRNALLYVRIKPTNHLYLKKVAKENGVTVTEYVDAIFDAARGA